MIVEHPTLGEIEFPDGTPPEQIRAAIQKAEQASAPAQETFPEVPVYEDDAPASTAAPARSMGEELFGLAEQFAAGANRGVVKLAELPYDAINNFPRLANLIPGVEAHKLSDTQGFNQVFTREDPLQEAAQMAGVADPNPTSPAERLAARVGEEIGMSAVPQAGITLRAQQLPRSIGAMNEASLFDRAVVLPFRDAPARANLAETAVAAGAGTGAHTSTENFGEGAGWDMLGALAGGVGTAAALNSAGNLFRLGQSAGTDRAARIGAGEQLVRAASDPNKAFSEQTVRRAAEAGAEIPGSAPTTGQASTDPGVLAMEYSRSTGGPSVGRYQQRQAENNAALRDVFDETAPAVADDAAARAELEARRQAVTGQARATTGQREAAAEAAAQRQQGLEQQRTAEQEGLEQEYGDIAAQRDLRAAGSEGVTDAYQSAREAVAGERRAAFDAAAEAGTTPVPAETFRGEAEAVLADIGPLADTAGDANLSRLVQDMQSLDADLTVADLIDLQPRLSRAMNSAQGAMRGDTVRALGRLNDKMRGTLDALAEQGDEGALAWQQANDLSRQEAPLFREGAGGQVDQQTRRGSAPAGTATASRFLRPDGPGAKEGADQLRQIIERAPDQAGANQAVRDYVVGSMADRMSGRRPDPKVVDTFLRQHSEVLRQFPEVNRELQQMRNQLQSRSSKIGDLEKQIKTASEGTKEAEKSATRAGKRAEGLERTLESDKSTVGRYLNRETGKESMGRILAANKPREEARKLMQQVRRSPEAQEGVRRAFFDLMDDSVSSTNRDINDNPLFKKDAFIKFLNRNDEVAKEVLGAEHAGNLRKIANQLDVLSRTANARPAGSSGTAAGNQGTGITLNSVLSRIYGIQRGVVSPRFVASELLTRQLGALARASRGGEISQLLDDALLDPETARVLTMEYSKENDRLLTKRLPAIMARLGIRTGRADAAGDDTGDEE